MLRYPIFLRRNTTRNKYFNWPILSVVILLYGVSSVAQVSQLTQLSDSVASDSGQNLSDSVTPDPVNSGADISASETPSPQTDETVPSDTSTPAPTPSDVPSPSDTPAPTETPSPQTDETVPSDTSTPAPTPSDVPSPSDTPAPTETTTPSPTETPAPQVVNSGPMVRSISSPILKGTYHSGVVPIVVTFNEAVIVSGTPQLILSTGSPSTTAVDLECYLGKCAFGNRLYFRYHITPGNSTTLLDYNSSSALNLNGGSIRDAAGNDAVLTLPEPGSSGSLSGTSKIVIETSPAESP